MDEMDLHTMDQLLENNNSDGTIIQIYTRSLIETELRKSAMNVFEETEEDNKLCAVSTRSVKYTNGGDNAHRNQEFFVRPKERKMSNMEPKEFFNMNIIEEKVMNGEWEELENYLLGFTKLDDNRHSLEMFFVIRSRKYKDAIDRGNMENAKKILKDELELFTFFYEEAVDELKKLLNNDEKSEALEVGKQKNAKSSRLTLLDEIKGFVFLNPVLHDSLLRRVGDQKSKQLMIDSSVERQDTVIENQRKRPNEDLNSCASSSVVGKKAVASSSSGGGTASPQQSSDQEQVQVDVNHPDNIPRTVVVVDQKQGSEIKSFDFHPVQHTLLLVGTVTGDVALWDLSDKKQIAFKEFKVWKNLVLYMERLRSSALNDNKFNITVNRVSWNTEGTLFGVAFSRTIIHLHYYNGGGDVKNHIEIDAHTGSVTDLAFAKRNEKQCVITCGEDNTVKIWDAQSGRIQYLLEGPDPVFSVCAHNDKDSLLIYSTSDSGKVRSLLFDAMGTSIDYFDSPFGSRARMVYDGERDRIFLCGTNTKQHESFLVESSDMGSTKHYYLGLGRRSEGIVEFDAYYPFLAVRDELLIKFWYMDSPYLLAITDTDGGLPDTSCIRFNKTGSLLAVSTGDGFIVLANKIGASLFPNVEIAEDREMPITEISEPTGLRFLKLPNSSSPPKVCGLMYTLGGNAILALEQNGVHKLWKWQQHKTNLKASATMMPEFSLFHRAPNDCEQIPCFALSSDNYFLASASGGKVTVFNTNFTTVKHVVKKRLSFRLPSCSATSLAFDPQDSYTLAIGWDNCSIQIYDFGTIQHIKRLYGHQKKVTGLAFSNDLDILVSSGADALICSWDTKTWLQIDAQILPIPIDSAQNHSAHTRVQYHHNQTHILVIHATQIAIYNTAPRLRCMKQKLFPQGPALAITDATFSCDGSSVYACFADGSVNVFSTSLVDLALANVADILVLRCRISPAAYLPTNTISTAFPPVISANPKDHNQFVIGVNDEGVFVLEPTELEGKWGVEDYDERRASRLSLTLRQASN